MTHRTDTVTAGSALGTGVMKNALPGSRIDVPEVRAFWVKGENGLWGSGIRIGDAEMAPAKYARTPEQVQAWLMRQRAAHTFTGAVLPGVTDDNACHRCAGAGRIPAYDHIDAGLCYDCRGTGKHTGR